MVLDAQGFICYNAFKMKVHMLVCEDCGAKWRISDFFLDDGEEINCPNPKCGSPNYRKDGEDEVEEYKPLEWTRGWGV